MKPTSKKQDPVGKSNQVEWPFGRNNYLWFGVALATIIAGYISLSQGSETLAPVLLVVGYCVLIPVSLIVKNGQNQQNSAGSTLN
jgi:hypothetical protein